MTKRIDKLDPKWIDLLIASSIGTQLSLYSMTDPEGTKRVGRVHEMIHEGINKLWEAVKDSPKFSDMGFTMTAIQIAEARYRSFIEERMCHLLTEGMPSPSIIVKPH